MRKKRKLGDNYEMYKYMIQVKEAEDNTHIRLISTMIDYGAKISTRYDLTSNNLSISKYPQIVASVVSGRAQITPPSKETAWHYRSQMIQKIVRNNSLSKMLKVH